MKKEVENSDQGFKVVFFAALSMLFIKLYFSYYVYGTNDITSWMWFAMIIEKFGTFKIYALNSDYNHPPLMSWVLKLIIFAVHKTQLSFPYLFRLMPIMADFLSVIVIWKLLEKYLVQHKVLICLICVLNPINFLISAFHGNTDPVFVFLILLTLYLIEENKIILAGMVYGLSMCIKIVPLIFIPVFFYYLSTMKQKTTFFIFFLLVPVAVFAPYFIDDHHAVMRNIFSYNSNGGVWGIGHIISSMLMNVNVSVSLKRWSYAFLMSYTACFKLILLLIEILLIKFLTTARKSNLMELSFLTFSLFLVFTPGFGVQYLSWLSFFAIVIFPLLGGFYVLLGGFFLYRVYVYWGAGHFPYYANSWAVGPWGGFNSVLDIALWLLIVSMLMKFLIGKIFGHEPIW